MLVQFVPWFKNSLISGLIKHLVGESQEPVCRWFPNNETLRTNKSCPILFVPSPTAFGEIRKCRLMGVSFTLVLDFALSCTYFNDWKLANPNMRVQPSSQPREQRHLTLPLLTTGQG